uniref:Uncharacterized protein n=2 Tax=Cuerna arida TaxID=1464854 RepID=A0A1B6FWZ4_9HEMI
MGLKSLVCLALLATALFSVVLAAPKEKACTEYDKPCQDNGECCGGCCQNEKCVVYSDACVSATNPCYLYDCPPNKVCYLQQVECLQSPCKSIPACKANDSDYD